MGNKVITTDDLGNQFLETPEDAALAGRVPVDQEAVNAQVTAEARRQSASGRGLESFLSGAAEAVSLGLISPEGEMKDVVSENVGANIAGKVLGVAATLPVGGGAGAAAGGGKLARAAGAVGNITKYTPLGATALIAGHATRGLQGGKALVAAGAIEGALSSGISGLTGRIANDEEFTAETFLADVGMGALIGGGAGLAAAGVGKAADKLSSYRAAKAAGAAGDAAKPATQKQAFKALDDTVKRVTSPKYVAKNIEAKRAAGINVIAAKSKAWETKTRDLLAAKGVFSASDDISKKIAADFAAATDESLSETVKTMLASGDKAGARKALDNWKRTVDSFSDEWAEMGIRRFDPGNDVLKWGALDEVETAAGMVRERPILSARTEDEADEAIEALVLYRQKLNKVGDTDLLDAFDKPLAKANPAEGSAWVSDPDKMREVLKRTWAIERSADVVEEATKKGWVQGIKDMAKSDAGMAAAAILSGNAGVFAGMLGLKAVSNSKAVQGAIDIAKKAAVSGFVKSSKLAPAAAKGVARWGWEGSSYDDQIKSLRAIASESFSTHKRITQMMPEVVTAPGIQVQMQAKTKAAANYLLSKAPTPPQSSPFRSNRAWKPGPAEQSRWERVLDTANSPMSAIRSFSMGRIHPDEAEAFRELWPATYNRLVDAVLEEADTLADNMSTEQRVNLTILLGKPVHALLEGGTLSMIQGSYAPPEQQQPPPQQPHKTSERAENEATKTQKLSR